MAKKDIISQTDGTQEGKLKALQAAMAKIEKDFGKGSIMKMGEEPVENVEVITSRLEAVRTEENSWQIDESIALLNGNQADGRVIASDGMPSTVYEGYEDIQNRTLYVEYVSNRGRMSRQNILYGLCRGLGFTLGFSVLGALLAVALRSLVVENIPLIGGFLAEVIHAIEARM